MAIKARITKEEYDALDETLRNECYRADGDTGEYIADITAVGGFQLVDVTGLQKSLQAERARANAAEKKLKDFKDIDPQAARDALAKVAEMDNWDPEQKLAEHKIRFEKQLQAKYENEKKQLIEKHEQELAAARKEVSVLSDQLSETLVKNTAIAAINAAGGSVRALLPIIQAHTRVVTDESTGQRIVEILDDAGNPRLSPTSGKSGNMTVEELVAELKSDKEFAGLFRASGASGSGAGSQDRGGGFGGSGGQGANPFLTNTWNLTEQGRLQRDDPKAYERFKSEALAKEPQGLAAKMAAMPTASVAM